MKQVCFLVAAVVLVGCAASPERVPKVRDLPVLAAFAVPFQLRQHGRQVRELGAPSVPERGVRGLARVAQDGLSAQWFRTAPPAW